MSETVCNTRGVTIDRSDAIIEDAHYHILRMLNAAGWSREKIRCVYMRRKCLGLNIH
jgi:hypothetical protein